MANPEDRTPAQKALRMIYKTYQALQTGLSIQPAHQEVVRQALVLAAKGIIAIRKDIDSDKQIVFTGLDERRPFATIGLGEAFEAMAMVAQHISQAKLAVAFAGESLNYEMKHGEPLGVVTALRNLTIGYLSQGDLGNAENRLIDAENYVAQKKDFFPKGVQAIVQLRRIYEEQEATRGQGD